MAVYVCYSPGGRCGLRTSRQGGWPAGRHQRDTCKKQQGQALWQATGEHIQWVSGCTGCLPATPTLPVVVCNSAADLLMM